MNELPHPKRGDRFIHARFLNRLAHPPYGPDDYAEHVVTAVRGEWPNQAVYHTSAERYDDGYTGGTWRFELANIENHVRKWLDHERD